MDKNLNYTIRVNLVDQASNSADGVNRRLQQMAESAQQAAPRFNQLNMSIQQVARELPAFSYSISTGFMAISNNLPMLADAIQQIRRENEDLRASGQKTVPVWKQVAKSLLSWNTALSVGITLLTVYGSQIAEGISKMQLFKKAIDPTVEANKQLNEAIKKGTEEAQKELTQLNVLYGAATDDTRRRKERLDAVKQLQDQYPAYFKNLSDESIMAGQAADAYARLTKSLTDAAIARASMDKMTENATKLLDLRSQEESLKSQLDHWKEVRKEMQGNVVMISTGINAYNQVDTKVMQVESSLHNVRNEIEAINTANDKLASGINISSLASGGGKGSTTKELNTNLATTGGLINRINELRVAQSKASAEQAINLEKEIQLYQQRLNLLQLTIARGAAGRLADSQYKENIAAPDINSLALPELTIPIQFDTNRLRENFRIMQQMFSDSIKEMTVLSSKQITGLLSQSFASIGTAIASGDVLDSFKSSLMMLMDMLQQFGAALIAAGVASEALKVVAWSGIGAIIAGGALIAATAAAKAALNRATAFANGGIVSGPTLALVGEYPGASSNPEVIAPLNKLKSMIEPAVPNDTTMSGEVRFVIRGEVLEGILNKMNRKRMRTR